MSFLNPGLLFGLFALAIPFIVLLLYRKKIVLNWAAYEWMAKASVKKHKQNILDDILKLLAKLLLLLFLVLLMARPALKSSGQGSRLVVIDITPSMATVIDGGTRLTRAREMAASFLEQAQGESAVAAFDGTLIPLAPLSGSPDPTVVETATLTGNTGGFEQFVTSLLALENLTTTPEVLFFTDAQRSDFEDATAIQRLMKTLAPTRIVLIPVDTRESTPNLGITRLKPPAEGYLPGRANPLQVTIRNFSDQPSDAIPVVATSEGEVQDRITINLPPGAEQTVELLVNSPPGSDSRRITVELPPDTYPLDDTWYLVTDPPERLRVLAVVPPPGDDPFEYDVFFQSALRAYVPEAHLNYQQVRPQQLLSLRLQNYDAVVTFGVPLTEGNPLSGILSQYVHDGGSLLAFADPGSAGNWEGIQWAAAPNSQSPAVPDPDRLSDGILDFMLAPGLDSSRLRFLKFTTLTAEEPDRLVDLSGTREPLALRVQRGRGRIILCGFLPYTGYTDLVYNPNFVQFSMRLLQYALPGTNIRTYAGRELEHIDIPPLEKGAGYTLRRGDEPAQMLEVRRPDFGDPYLVGEPLAENTFATVRKEEEDLFELGYNLTRRDSDIDGSSPTELEPILSENLTVQIDKDSSAEKMHIEHAGLMAFLLLLAVAFDTYAHLWRRG